MAEPVRIRVAAEKPYDVLIGHDLAGDLTEFVRGAAGHGAVVAIVHQPTLVERAEAVRTAFTDAGIDAHRIEIPDAEDGKELPVAAFCWEVLGRIGLDRTGVVVGLGGGAATDLAGFVGIGVHHDVGDRLADRELDRSQPAAGGSVGLREDADGAADGAHPPSGGRLHEADAGNGDAVLLAHPPTCRGSVRSARSPSGPSGLRTTR